MWIFTSKGGFISVVSDKENSRNAEFLLVRARARNDIEQLFGAKAVPVLEDTTGEHDYRWRAWVPRFVCAKVLAREILNISYSNYKASISDQRRLWAYHQVWATMAELQDTLVAQERGERD